MKRIILIIALALPLISLSQINKSILDTSKTWYNGVSHLNGKYTNIYKIKQDTLIESKSYNKVYSYYSGDSNYLEYGRLIFFVREDSNRVFIREIIYPYTISEEYIVYDFNLNKGDTITVPVILGGDIWSSYSYNRGLITIDSVDSVNINGSLLKRLFISSEYCYIEGEQWIEGIGSTQGLFEAGTVIDGGTGILNCLYQGDLLIYHREDSPNCIINVGLEDVNNDISVKLYPTIVDDVLNISSTDYPLNISFIDMFGREVVKETLYYDKTINTSALKSGYFTCKLTSKNNKTLIEKIIKR